MPKTLFTLLALLIAAALFYFRPWSEYSPAEMFNLFHPDKRVAHFQAMEGVMPARTVKAGSNPFEFARAERPLPVNYRFDGEQRSLDGFLERVDGTGLLVIQNDHVIHENYRLGGHPESRFTSWSVAKSFVATLVGIARDEGLIRSLDDAISDYLPELKGSAYDGIPVKHVLQMSSGVRFDETYDNRFSDIQLFFWKVFIQGRPVAEIVRDYPQEVPSGTRYHYASIDTQVLGLMLREIYGKPLEVLLSEKLWQPLGMEADALWNVASEEPDSAAIAFCCLNARLRDFAKLGRLYLRHGDWDGTRIVSKEWVLEATTPGAPHLEPGAITGRGPRGYQYQWWIPEKAEREYMAMGVWGQYIYISEPDKLIIVRSSADPGYWDNVAETITVFRAIRDALREQSESAVVGQIP